jgi:hypothetical protein
MIVEIVALLFAALTGWTLARRAGESILLGIALAAGVLLLFSVAGVPWSFFGVGATMAVIAIAAILLRRTGFSPSTKDGGLKPALRFAILFDLLALVILGGYALFATMAPLWEFDYIGDFGLKGRWFFEARAIDWNFLSSPVRLNIHPDYPPLVPLAFDFLALARGQWNDAAHGLLNVAWALALLLVIRRLALEELGSHTAAAFITAAMVPVCASPWVGLADGAFVAFGTAAVLLLRTGDERRVTMAAILLGCAASTKNEGIALIVAVAIGLVYARRREWLPRLWPALAIPLPWWILRGVHHLQTDLAASGVFARLAAHLADPTPLLIALARYPVGKPLFWTGIAIALILIRRAVVDRERFAVTVVLLQFAAYVGAYLISPHDLTWQVKWSWERIVSHLTPILTYVILVNLCASIERGAPPTQTPAAAPHESSAVPTTSARAT